MWRCSPVLGAAPVLGASHSPCTLILKFQMHTKNKILLKMFCFVFLFQHVSSFAPLCLKDELSVTFSQSFLLTNLGKVNGSVHAPLCPLRISL